MKGLRSQIIKKKKKDMFSRKAGINQIYLGSNTYGKQR